MKRVEGWEQFLTIYLNGRRDMLFQWGQNDCCTFACGGLAVQGIENPMSGLRSYKTAKGAIGMIKRFGGSLDIVAERLLERIGLHSVAPAFAGRGCMVLGSGETPNGNIELALGLVDVNGSSALFVGTKGLLSRPLTECHLAWQFD